MTLTADYNVDKTKTNGLEGITKQCARINRPKTNAGSIFTIRTPRLLYNSKEIDKNNPVFCTLMNKDN